MLGKIQYSLFLLFCLSGYSYADSLTGRVVRVIDGDTVVFLSNNKEYRLRLAGIDTPEKKQPYGQKAKTTLSGMVINKPVTITYEKQDRYGRTIAILYVDDVDINNQMVQKGLAWHYKKYQRDQSITDRELYASSERSARIKEVNIWSLSNPIAPWDWRKQKRSKK